MIPKKPAPHLMRGGTRFSDQIMLQQETSASRYPFELLQAAHDLRHRRVGEARLPVRHTDFAEIDVALRIERDAMRREEFSCLQSGSVLAAEPRDALALRVDDSETRAEIG